MAQVSSVSKMTTDLTPLSALSQAEGDCKRWKRQSNQNLKN